MLNTLRSLLPKLYQLVRPGFRENPELETLIRDAAILRRRAAGLDPEVGEVSREECRQLLDKIEEMMLPRRDELKKYLDLFLKQQPRYRMMDWHGELTPEWDRQFAAREIPWLRRK